MAEGEDGAPRYRCPGPETGEATHGPIPSLRTQCGAGSRPCTPSTRPHRDGEYAASEWHADVWTALDFAIAEPHRLHYALHTSASPQGCLFTAQAFGDLDDDGVWSTYELAGALDSWGPNEALGLFVDRPGE
jgi:type IV pilus assembly protein PilA